MCHDVKNDFTTEYSIIINCLQKAYRTKNKKYVQNLYINNKVILILHSSILPTADDRYLELTLHYKIKYIELCR